MLPQRLLACWQPTQSEVMDKPWPCILFAGIKSKETVKNIDIKIKSLGFTVKVTPKWLAVYYLSLSETDSGRYYVDLA